MSEGVDEGEKKGGGNKRKEVDQEEIGGRKKKAKPGQERRGESRGLWTRDKGLLSRTLQRAIGGRGRKALRAGLYLGRVLHSTARMYLRMGPARYGAPLKGPGRMDSGWGMATYGTSFREQGQSSVGDIHFPSLTYCRYILYCVICTHLD